MGKKEVLIVKTKDKRTYKFAVGDWYNYTFDKETGCFVVNSDWTEPVLHVPFENLASVFIKNKKKMEGKKP